jgi:hypothetical protein
VPEQVELIPNDTTATRVVVPETKMGPPESPKQVPPVLALLENLAASSGMNSELGGRRL